MNIGNKKGGDRKVTTLFVANLRIVSQKLTPQGIPLAQAIGNNDRIQNFSATSTLPSAECADKIIKFL